jgi:hypothetical protein
MKFDALIEKAEEIWINELKKEFYADAELASALRWIFRGLNPTQAIRKVKVDREISASARGKRAHY